MSLSMISDPGLHEILPHGGAQEQWLLSLFKIPPFTFHFRAAAKTFDATQLNLLKKAVFHQTKNMVLPQQSFQQFL